MPFTVSIVGRPNVGKSTLFNRMTRTRHALVHDMPGVTRDRREGEAQGFDVPLTVIDTPGLEESEGGTLESRMMEQTMVAIEQSQLCLIVLDGRVGVTPVDQFFIKMIRKSGKPTILVVNKCEGDKGDIGLHEAFGLGFDEVLPISAEHNEGVGELFLAIENRAEAMGFSVDADMLDGGEKSTQIAILGRPNSGKSTLVNRVLGEERVLTGPEAGVTRDSIAVPWEYEGRSLRLIDTAGMRRRSNVKKGLEQLSVSDTLRALQYAHVVVLLLDATCPMEKQDLTIAQLVIKEGRSLVVGVNKWDLVAEKKHTLEELQYRLEKSFPDIKGVSLVPISAKDGTGVDKLFQEVLNAYDIWNKRISTSELNDWLRYTEQSHNPPLGKQKRRIRLKYITQGNIRPPTFTMFVNYPDELPESYRRYVINALRDSFSMPGVPVRLMVRKADNPYANRKKSRKS
jgi:GTP-binding protein